jgi:hypothetical protein
VYKFSLLSVLIVSTHPVAGGAAQTSGTGVLVNGNRSTASKNAIHPSVVGKTKTVPQKIFVTAACKHAEYLSHSVNAAAEMGNDASSTAARAGPPSKPTAKQHPTAIAGAIINLTSIYPITCSHPIATGLLCRRKIPVASSAIGSVHAAKEDSIRKIKPVPAT